MVTLRDVVKSTRGSVSFVSDNELALNGELPFNPKGWCRITNDRETVVLTYKVARTGAAGRHLHDPIPISLYPGKTIEHDGGTEWGVGTRVYSFLAIPLPTKDGEWTGETPTETRADNQAIDDPGRASGDTPDPGQEFWDWLEANKWLVVGVAILIVVVVWLTYGGGLKSLIG